MRVGWAPEESQSARTTLEARNVFANPGEARGALDLARHLQYALPRTAENHLLFCLSMGPPTRTK